MEVLLEIHHFNIIKYAFRELEELFSPDGRRIVAKALMLYWDTNYEKMDLKTKERIKSLMDNIVLLCHYLLWLKYLEKLNFSITSAIG